MTIMELYILEVRQTHTPHPAQFGFVDGTGTDMAISLAHDVMVYFNGRGSAVYTCSLDAEGAFDAMPHVVIFGKLDGIVPDYAWRVMYAWYRQMYVTIRQHGALGQRLPVRRGTRQGGLSSLSSTYSTGISLTPSSRVTLEYLRGAKPTVCSVTRVIC